jgi:heme/copper-type cytochrome/quinol oxidase subunit 3
MIGVIVVLNLWLWPPKIEREMRLAGHPSRTTLFGLPVYLSGPLAPGWWAMLIAIVICAVGEACLIFSYFYLRASASVWPPDNLPAPHLLLPLVALTALAASALPMRWAETSILRGRQVPVLIGLAAGFALAAAYFVFEIADLARAGFTHQTNAYGSVFFGTMALQIVFVFAGLIMCANVQAQAWLGYFNRWRHLAIQNTAFWWYFLVANGLVCFLVLYLTPYVI